MNWFTIGWLAWLAWFVVEEGLSIRSGAIGNTLSGHVWKWFSIRTEKYPDGAQVQKWVRVRRFILLAFLAWLTAHFLTGGRF